MWYPASVIIKFLQILLLLIIHFYSKNPSTHGGQDLSFSPLAFVQFLLKNIHLNC